MTPFNVYTATDEQLDWRAERGPARALPFKAFDEIAIEVEKDWITKNALAWRETSSWVGAPGKGKSLLLTDIALHACRAVDWRGYRAKARVAVVFLAFERADLLERRLEAYRRRHGLKGLPIAIVRAPVNLMDPASVAILTDTIESVGSRFGLKVGLLILDTFAKAIAYGGGEENSAKDQNRVLGHLREVQRHTDVHVALIGHVGKDEAKGARGSNAHLGDVDLMVTISGEAVKTATITKANDQAEGPLTSFTIETYEFGQDEDGDPITTSIMSDDVPEQEPSSRPARMNHGEQVAMKMLREALAEAGERPPTSNHIPEGVKTVVTKDLWRRYCYQGGISADDATQDAQRKAFKRAVQSLHARDLVGVWEPFVWVIHDDHS